MDRRQRKSRSAIFKAFCGLLSEKNYNKITVEDIISRADIGRTTFYSHFETKDFLLKEFCGELFEHIFDAEKGSGSAHSHIFDCENSDSVFLHLLQHLEKNDNNILELLSSENNELFLVYFKDGVSRLIESRKELFEKNCENCVPQDFRLNHISAAFVEAIRWWIANKMQQTPEEINKYFLSVI